MADMYMGQIWFAGFPFAAKNNATCQGQIIAISQNSALFSLLGTTFGGNGQNTFQLPNAGGRTLLGQGQAPGVGHNYQMGEIAGTENVTLTTAQMPMHVHAVSSPVTVEAMGGIGAAQESDAPAAGSYLGTAYDSNGSAAPVFYVPAGTTGGTAVNLAGCSVNANTTVAGGSQAFSVMQPYLVINALICTQGVFPSRN
ncbi:phage tail protein [Sphingomonas sp. MMS12-HWE2-04]|uniref:phage tail protein n=1 Tax=Sphingomonas sp. MMS12-HWE2-04 TaxID=3234199 RepID=UPI00384EF1F5